MCDAFGEVSKLEEVVSMFCSQMHFVGLGIMGSLSLLLNAILTFGD